MTQTVFKSFWIAFTTSKTVSFSAPIRQASNSMARSSNKQQTYSASEAVDSISTGIPAGEWQPLSPTSAGAPRWRYRSSRSATVRKKYKPGVSTFNVISVATTKSHTGHHCLGSMTCIACQTPARSKISKSRAKKTSRSRLMFSEKHQRVAIYRRVAIQSQLGYQLESGSL